jgi:hypothetical protein
MGVVTGGVRPDADLLVRNSAVAGGKTVNGTFSSVQDCLLKLRIIGIGVDGDVRTDEWRPALAVVGPENGPICCLDDSAVHFRDAPAIVDIDTGW